MWEYLPLENDVCGGQDVFLIHYGLESFLTIFLFHFWQSWFSLQESSWRLVKKCLFSDNCPAFPALPMFKQKSGRQLKCHGYWWRTFWHVLKIKQHFGSIFGRKWTDFGFLNVIHMQIEKMQIWKKILKKRKKKSKRKQVKQNRLIRIYFSFSYKMFAIFNKSQLIFNPSKQLWYYNVCIL